MGTGSPRPTKLALLTVAFLAALLSVILMEEPIGGVPRPESLPASPRAVVGADKTKTSSATTSTSMLVTSSTLPAPPPPTTTTPSISPKSVTAVTAPEPAPAPSGVVSASGDELVLNGQPYHFVGVNAYEIATEWGVNAGCGPQLSDAQLDQLFAALPPDSMVRFWAFQGTMATNVTTRQIDWAPLDRVFAAAAQYHQRLIPVLAGESGSCDSGHWADLSWYDGGFLDVFNAGGMTPLSYWDYLQAIVNRYKDSPALGMWEPMSEAEASTCPAQFEPDNCNGNQTCPNEQAAAQALRHFFDVVGGEIHTLDPRHLVEAGLLGSGQCGAVWNDYSYVGASPGIDVLSYHDYGAPDTPIPGDQWNGLAVRIAQTVSLGKPIIIGEEGINAGTACLSDSRPRRRPLRRRPGPSGRRHEGRPALGLDARRFEPVQLRHRAGRPHHRHGRRSLARLRSIPDMTGRPMLRGARTALLRGEFPVTRFRCWPDLPTIPSCAHRW